MRLLLINGWSAPNTVWQSFVEELNALLAVKGFQLEGYEILAIDRCLSRSEWLELIDTYVAEDTVLVGWSLGGMLAMAYAAQSSRRFLGLITLMSNLQFTQTEHCPWAMPEKDFGAFKEGLDSDKDAAVLVLRFASLMAQGDSKFKLALRILRDCYREAGDPEPALLKQSLGLLGQIDLGRNFADVAVPTLMLFGSDDALSGCPSSSQAESLVALNPKSAVQILPTGHLPFAGARRITQDYLAEFMVANA